MSKQSLITIESLMEQAQVYASAWSLVGGMFDQGNQLQAAEEEKVRLEAMLEDFQEQTDANAAPGNLQEIAEGLVAWHQGRMKNISSVLGAPADTEVHLGETVLTGEKLQGFRIGLIIAQEWFEKFPLSITPNTPDSEEE
ncbi:MAG TPA: host nuclease inhibitor protein [Pseudomonas sp.]|uniref:host nuclease inhibitor protein n=1 Tax=Pseudomonas sp. TaxID=306 RepID=UPI002C7F8410|nr:host nuclease inhibitor protein [Pseudomonas sp.]HRL94740.1 host nuclease inhibitor protein [Pseudomonas sp.]